MDKRIYRSPQLSFLNCEEDDVLTASFGYQDDVLGNDDNDVDLFGGFGQ